MGSLREALKKLEGLEEQVSGRPKAAAALERTHERVKGWQAEVLKALGQHEYHPDWSKATVRVGSHIPSRAVQALIAAYDPAHPRVTPREALERLAVLRILETPV